MHRAVHPAVRRLARFGRDEDGSMIVFGLFLLVLMLIAGGMSVDIMHHEATRTRMQAALDRSVLAAASLEQQRNPEGVVRDYLDKAGLGEFLTTVTVDQTINSRRVTASADAVLDTYFMKLAGFSSLSISSSSTAFESRSDIEIVLVLDVSGSMSSNSRIVNLRAAAQEFVQTVLANDVEHRVSVAIVPFNAQVNLGPTLFNAMVDGGYNITNRHGVPNSHCLDVPESAFDSLAITTALALPQAGYFDGESTTHKDHTMHVAPQAISTGKIPCRTETQNFVRLPSQDIATMRSQLASLRANGNTSITLGMKWGLALLDPASRTLFSSLIQAGRMPDTLSGRPFDYDRADTLKVVVVMTDGEHVASPFLKAGYRTETSPIFRAGTGTYSLHRDRAGTTADYWAPGFDPDQNAGNGVPGGWRVTPYDGTFDEDTDGAGPDTDTDGTGAVTQLAWHQVWQSVRVSWVAWQLYARASCPIGNTSSNNACRIDIFDDQMDLFREFTVASDMDSTLQRSCQQARDRDVVIYGIAFEAPVIGQEQIFDCSSSPAHYYNAQGLQIQTVFRSIAADINSLRLER